MLHIYDAASFQITFIFLVIVASPCFKVFLTFFQYYARDCLGRASSKWPILCQVGC